MMSAVALGDGVAAGVDRLGGPEVLVGVAAAAILVVKVAI